MAMRLRQADSKLPLRSLPVSPCPRCGGTEFRVASVEPVGYRCAYCRIPILVAGWKAYWPRVAP